MEEKSEKRSNKNVIGIFTSPVQTMQDMFAQDPPKGIKLGMLWVLLGSILLVIINVLNPGMQAQVAQMLRNSGATEEIIQMSQKMSLVGGAIGGIVATLIGILILTTLLRFGTEAVKGKGTFKANLIVVVSSYFVQILIGIIDGIIGYVTELPYTILGISLFFSTEQISKNPLLKTLVDTVNLSTIWGIVILVIGFKIANKTTTKKSIMVVLVIQLLSMAFLLGSAYLGSKMNPAMAIG